MHGNTTHGLSKSREYKHWEIAKRRCFNPNYENFHYYGGRGITMEEPWRSDFSAFYRDMGPCPEGFTLERRDSDGNYTRKNCEWLPANKQTSNRRNCVYFNIDGERLTMAEAARRHGLKPSTVWMRLGRGDSQSQALRPVA